MNELHTLKEGEKITVITQKDNGFREVQQGEYHSHYNEDGIGLMFKVKGRDQAFSTFLTGDNVAVVRGWVDVVYLGK
jgi:Cu/Ag efflux protein CusF